MMLVAVTEEAECRKTGRHYEYCMRTHHVCYRCGMLIGPCNCPELGSLLDY